MYVYVYMYTYMYMCMYRTGICKVPKRFFDDLFLSFFFLSFTCFVHDVFPTFLSCLLAFFLSFFPSFVIFLFRSFILSFFPHSFLLALFHSSFFNAVGYLSLLQPRTLYPKPQTLNPRTQDWVRVGYNFFIAVILNSQEGINMDHL